MNNTYLATKNNLIKTKATLNLSKQGHELLEKKRYILLREMNKYKDEYLKLKENIVKLFEEGYFYIQNANVDIGIDELINISNSIKEENNIDIKYKTVMGVEIPSVICEPEELKLSYGLYNTSISVDEAIIKFNEIKNNIIRLAEVENIIFRLKEAIAKVQKRSNALKDIIIPKNEQIVKQIQNILEERDREELIRMKKIKENM